MTYATYSSALAETRRFTKAKHRILKCYRHADNCLYSDGTITPSYPCSCKPVFAGYTLQLVHT